MNSIIIPVNEGGFLSATIWERSDAKAIVILHPATAVVQAFYKGFAEYLFNQDSVSSLTIIGERAARNPGSSVATASQCQTGSSRTWAALLHRLKRVFPDLTCWR